MTSKKKAALPAKKMRKPLTESFRPADVQSSIVAEPLGFDRQTHSKWTVQAKVTVDAKLPDGRELHAVRKIRLGNIAQQGRRGSG